MSDEETDEPKGYDTDWLANCPYGYGYGYTREQALAVMSEYVRCDEGDTFEVDLFEHTGNVKQSAFNITFEGEVVSHERVTIEVDREWQRFRDAAVTAIGVGARYAERAESVGDDDV
jgi:hypothetical protein